MKPDLLYIIYIVVSWGLVLYGINFYYLLYRSLAASMEKRGLSRWEPLVTVQLPIYNERYVALRLIKAVCNLDYPKERLQIQILDDSDDDTVNICKAAAEYYSKKGFDIQYLHREHREGYKAGALQMGLEMAKGELIAIFDADFVPPKDFLRRTLAYLEVDEKIGLVQARWGHLNADYSHLTRAQALNLDLHFLMEQRARSQGDLFMNFNGTAGVWRKACIIDAGGWQDTLAEDLDLSYRAQMKGWRLIFLDDLVCPAELPVQMNAAKRQQYRWAKGAMQCTKKLALKVLLSGVPIKTKVMALLHLTRHVVHLLALVQFLVLPILMAQRYDLYPIAAILGQLLLGPTLYFYAMRSFFGERWWRRLLDYPLLLLFAIGLSANNTLALLDGLLGKRGVFFRTPKFGITRKEEDWRSKLYVLPFTKTTLLELALALYGSLAIIVAFFTRNFLLLPYLLLVTLGFYYVGVTSILHSLNIPGRREEAVPLEVMIRA